MFKRIASGALACVALAVSSRAATLSGTFTAVSAGTAVDLSSAGMEWAQWGLDTGVNRKAGVSSQIADVIVFGPNSSEMISNFPVLFNWTNGTPVQAGTNVTTALAVKGVGNGFAFTVPADLVKRKLRLYAGGAAAQMRVDATLSDASASAFSDSSLSASSDGAAGVYDFDYSAASVGQTLNVSVTLAAASDETIGNVQLAAAILSSNLPPVVTITSPTNNVILTAPANVSVMLDAQDADGAISKVELYRSGSKIADLTNAPYSFLMTNLAAGSYGLLARAFDNNGDSTDSPSVNFSVISNTPPQITLLSPTNDQNFSRSDTIFLSATAQDAEGSVVRVEWYVDNNKVGESANAPYSFQLTNLTVGFHTIKAVAVDQFQAQKASSPATIAVYSGLGSLTFTYATAPTAVNLSAEGLSDWAHWGLYTESSFNHKAGVTPQIANYSIVGNDMPYSYADNFTTYSWNNGTPIASATNTPTGVYFVGLKNGFEVRVAADTTIKTLKLYLGTFAARGHLRVYLTDLSTPVNFDDSLDNPSNGPDAVYTIHYQAGAPGQSLVAQYTVSAMHDTYGNVTLQAATLVSDNNPPLATLVSPTNNAVFLAPANITLEANATDSDGTVARVEFYQGATKLAETNAPPYQFTWTNVAAGIYPVTVRAIDNKGATYTSPPAEISVINGGGILAGRFAPSLPQVNLSFEGRNDWGHWGYRSLVSFDHKRAVPQQVSNFVAVGSAQTSQYSDNLTTFAWSDGTPTLSAGGTRTGLYRAGLSNGFEIVFPADQTLRRLKMYVGLYGARGRFQATLSDLSAARFLDNSLLNAGSSGVGTYTLFYAAASAGQRLTVRYTSDVLFDQQYGNVTLQAASMATVPPMPALQLLRTGAGLTLSFATEPSFGYSVECSPSVSSPSWNVLSNIVAIGLETTLTNVSNLAPQRFYRVRMQ